VAERWDSFRANLFLSTYRDFEALNRLDQRESLGAGIKQVQWKLMPSPRSPINEYRMVPALSKELTAVLLEMSK
jgi:hypothetical protein